MIHPDIKHGLETITELKAYPVYIPASVDLPAVAYRLENRQRNEDSNLDDLRLKDYTFSFFVAGKEFSDVYMTTEKIVSEFEDYSGNIGATEVLISRVNQIQDDYDHSQELFVQSIQVTLMVQD